MVLVLVKKNHPFNDGNKGTALIAIRLFLKLNGFGLTASVTELQKDPIGTAVSGNGAAVAILNWKALAFYCVPADEYHGMVDRLDNIKLNALAETRRGGLFVKVVLGEL